MVLPTDESQNAELRREDRNVLPLEEGLYQLFRFSGVKSGFRMFVDRAAQFNDLRQNLGARAFMAVCREVWNASFMMQSHT